MGNTSQGSFGGSCTDIAGPGSDKSCVLEEGNDKGLGGREGCEEAPLGEGMEPVAAVTGHA